MEQILKRESTQRLVHALNSLSILSPFKAVENQSYTEIYFRVPEEGKAMWQNLIRKILFALVNKVFINKKYLLKDGDLAFTWSINICSETEEDVDKNVNEVAEFILTKISKAKDVPVQEVVLEQPKKAQPVRFGKRHFVKPITVKEGGIMEWEIPLTNTTSKRGMPKPGSSKGAFGLDDKGSGHAALINNFYSGKTRNRLG